MEARTTSELRVRPNARDSVTSGDAEHPNAQKSEHPNIRMPLRNLWHPWQIAKLVDAARIFHLLGSGRWEQLAEVVPPHSAVAVKRKFGELRRQGALDHLDQNDLWLRASRKVKPLPVHPPAPMTSAEAEAAAAAEGLTLRRADNETGFVGVYQRKDYGRPKPYVAQVFRGRRGSRFLGAFATAEEAALSRARYKAGGEWKRDPAPSHATPEPRSE